MLLIDKIKEINSHINMRNNLKEQEYKTQQEISKLDSFIYLMAKLTNY